MLLLYDGRMPKQLSLFDVPPRFDAAWMLTPTEVRLGKHWLPICRRALATATEVDPPAPASAVPPVLRPS